MDPFARRQAVLLEGGFMQRVLRFLREEDGPTAVEYAVMLALIIGVCMGAVMTLGNATAGSFQASNDAMFGGP
jgi:pilus assembly protein Flp/PilA